VSSALRCPTCHALVVDRRFANCTTCHVALPPEWVLTPDQIAKLETIDQRARTEHAAAMEELDPNNDPTTRESLPQIEPDST
jgi:hypothetical protein